MSKRTKVQLHKERAFPTKRKLSSQKILYMKPPSHAMNKTTARIFIQVQQNSHLTKDVVPIKVLLTQNIILAEYKNDTEFQKEYWKIKRRNSAPQKGGVMFTFQAFITQTQPLPT